MARVLATGREMQPAREMNPAERRGDGRAATVGKKTKGVCACHVATASVRPSVLLLINNEGLQGGSPGFARRVSSRKMASRSHLPTAATAARRLFRHRGAGHRPALCSCRPHRAGFAGTRRRTLLRPRRCDVWRRGAGRQASSPTWSLAGPLGSATRRPSSHELQTATGRHA